MNNALADGFDMNRHLDAMGSGMTGLSNYSDSGLSGGQRGRKPLLAGNCPGARD